MQKIIFWNYYEVNGYGYFKNYNRVMVSFCSDTNIIQDTKRLQPYKIKD